MKNLNHAVSLIQQNYTTVKVDFSQTPRLKQEEPSSIIVPTPGPWDDGQLMHNLQRGQPKQQVYTYKCPLPLAERLKAGDLVITPETANRGVGIGTVVAIDIEPDINLGSNFDYKWIVGKVESDDYFRILAQEKEMVRLLREAEKRKARDELVEAYKASLPEGSEARKLFDQAARLGQAPSE